MNSLGTVVVDNTTIFGAKRALETWPPRAENWGSGAPAVDLRSLMDVLEEIILHEELLVDDSSRDGEAWYELSAAGVLREDDLLDNSEHYGILMKSALTTIQDWIQTGKLAAERERIVGLDPSAVMPEIYQDPEEFYRFTASTDGLTERESAEFLVPLRQLLDIIDKDLASYAMFAFRGFYYQELAHLISASYSPHRWRSPLVDAITSRRSFRFAEFALNLAVELRRDLTQRLNGEFGIGHLTADLPLLASFIASQASRRSELLSIALQLRNNKKVVAFRRWVEGLQAAIETQSDLGKLDAASNELQELVADLRRDLGIRRTDYASAGQAITLKLGVPTGISGLQASAESTVYARIPAAWRYIFGRRTHLVFLRKLAKTAPNISPFSVAFSRLPA